MADNLQKTIVFSAAEPLGEKQLNIKEFLCLADYFSMEVNFRQTSHGELLALCPALACSCW